VVEWWSGGVVEWWSGGVVEWWSGGVLVFDLVLVLNPFALITLKDR
jgi:hypothetical protein